jgi:hypothetical protein
VISAIDNAMVCLSVWVHAGQKTVILPGCWLHVLCSSGNPSGCAIPDWMTGRIVDELSGVSLLARSGFVR